METRVITEKEEQAIRLVHHDFDGYPIGDAARVMGTTVKEVKALLKSVKRKAPQLFPILTPRQQTILGLYGQSLSRATISVSLGITVAALAKEIEFLRGYGFLNNKEPVSYVPSEHDEQIREKF